MTRLPTRRINFHIAINERGEYRVSELDPQEALTALASSSGGTAFRVVDIEVDVLFACVDETRNRRARALDIRLVK